MMHVRKVLEMLYRLLGKAVLRDFLVSGGPSFRVLSKGWESPKSESESPLFADAELADHTLIALGIVSLEIVEQAAALADQH